MTLTSFLLFIVLTFFMGFVAAIPVGGSQLETVRRSINGYLLPAFMVVLGSVSSDAIYGVIAVFGLAPFLQNKTVVSIFWLFNAAIMILIGILLIRSRDAKSVVDTNSKQLIKRKDLAFFTGITLAATNPMMIAWWLMGEKLLIDLGIVDKFSLKLNIIYLTAGVSGLFSYLASLAMITFHIKKFISEKAIKRISKIFGVIMIVFSLYFIFKSLSYFIGG